MQHIIFHEISQRTTLLGPKQIISRGLDFFYSPTLFYRGLKMGPLRISAIHMKLLYMGVQHIIFHKFSQRTTLLGPKQLISRELKILTPSYVLHEVKMGVPWVSGEHTRFDKKVPILLDYNFSQNIFQIILIRISNRLFKLLLFTNDHRLQKT